MSAHRGIGPCYVWTNRHGVTFTAWCGVDVEILLMAQGIAVMSGVES